MTEETLPMDAVEQNAPAATPQQDGPQHDIADGPPAVGEERFAAPQPRAEPRGRPNSEHQLARLQKERDEAKAAHAALQRRLDDMSAIAGEDPSVWPEDLRAMAAAEQAGGDPLAPLAEKIDAIDRRLEAVNAQHQAEAIDRQVRAIADADEARFRQRQPDFPRAVQHYILSRLHEMNALGLTTDQAEEAITIEAQQLLYQCAQTNRSAAEAIYSMARARGYGSGGSGAGGGAQPQYARPAGGRSFGHGAGAAPGAITPQQLAAMSDEDYAAFRGPSKAWAAIRRAMGG